MREESQSPKVKHYVGLHFNNLKMASVCLRIGISNGERWGYKGEERGVSEFLLSVVEDAKISSFICTQKNMVN